MAEVLQQEAGMVTLSYHGLGSTSVQASYFPLERHTHKWEAPDVLKVLQLLDSNPCLGAWRAVSHILQVPEIDLVRVQVHDGAILLESLEAK